jgi:dynein heavy chain 1
MLLLSHSRKVNSKGVSSDEEIYKSFIKNVQRNLHVVFTMNPNNPDFSNRTASSPACLTDVSLIGLEIGHSKDYSSC